MKILGCSLTNLIFKLYDLVAVSSHLFTVGDSFANVLIIAILTGSHYPFCNNSFTYTNIIAYFTHNINLHNTISNTLLNSSASHVPLQVF